MIPSARTQVLLLLCPLLLGSCHVGRFFTWNVPDIGDRDRFPKRTIEASSNVWELPSNSDVPFDMQQEVRVPMGKVSLEKLLKRTGTTAFIVIQNDSIIAEHYFHDFDAAEELPSFSVSKSFIGALVGIALEEGKFNSLSDSVGKYLPWLKHDELKAITLQHLLDMQSGVKYSELYFSPFSDVAKHYYGKQLKRYVQRLKVSSKPGTDFRYISVNSQLLSLALEAAYNKPVPELLEEKIWRPAGMEGPASWNFASEQDSTTKAFCCLNARARDFARFGLMYLNDGVANGQQIVPKDWIQRTKQYDHAKNQFKYNRAWWTAKIKNTVPDTTNLTGMWVLNKHKRQRPGKYHIIRPGSSIVAQGILGQTVYVRPSKDLVIVRLGKRNGLFLWANVCYQISKNMEAIKNGE